MEHTNSLQKNSSWVIKDKLTGEILFETFQKSLVDKINKDKYVAVPILQHLQELNQTTRINHAQR